VRHEFLSALIERLRIGSHRLGAAFLLARRAGELAGAMPLFVKSHSYGEYVFDWAWANAHERHGIAYYPKLLSAIPFTPVRGPRLLGNEKALLLDAALELARETSSLHVLFPPEEDLTVSPPAACCCGAPSSFTGATRGTPISTTSCAA
jgi:predicted N-acyltransferase